MHNKQDQTMGEAKHIQGIIKKIPVHRIISLFQVKLENKITFLTLFTLHVMENLFEHYAIVLSASTWNEAILYKGLTILSKKGLSLFTNTLEIIL